MKGVAEANLDENIDMDLNLGGESDYQEIDKLETAGVNVGDIKKLKAAGLYTLASIVMATSTHLQSIKGMSEAKVQKIMECVKKVRPYFILFQVPKMFNSTWP